MADDAELDAERVVRSYEFDRDGRRVGQVQGIVSDVGCYVVTGTAPLLFAQQLERVFEAAIASVRHAAD